MRRLGELCETLGGNYVRRLGNPTNDSSELFLILNEGCQALCLGVGFQFYIFFLQTGYFQFQSVYFYFTV